MSSKNIEEKKMNILFQGWINIPHSYAVVLCFKLVFLYKNFANRINFFVEEVVYYNPIWKPLTHSVFPKEYNEILKGFKKYNGEELDLIYRISFPYDIRFQK